MPQPLDFTATVQQVVRTVRTQLATARVTTPSWACMIRTARTVLVATGTPAPSYNMVEQLADAAWSEI